MARFRKKPVVVEAIRFDGTIRGIEEAQAFIGPEAKTDIVPTLGYVVCIPTREGEMRAVAGDWIIKGIAGEFYPCKPDIFAATYEAVPTTPDPKATAELRHDNEGWERPKR